VTTIVFNRDTYDLPLLLFEKAAVDRELSRWRHASWRTEATTLENLRHVAFAYDHGAGFRAVRLEAQDGLTFVSLDRQGHVEAWLAAGGDAALDRLQDEIRQQLPVAPDDDSGRVAVRFWTLQGNEPTSVVRTVAVPGWTDVRRITRTRWPPSLAA